MSHSERWIFSLEPNQCLQKGVEIVNFFWFDSKRHNWIRNMHFSHLKFHVTITESFSRSTVDTKKSKDISSTCFSNIFHISRMHSDHSRYFNFLTCISVQNNVSFLNLALVYSNICNLSKFGFFKLKCQSYKRLFVIDNHLCLFTIFINIICIIDYFFWVRKIVKNSIHHFLHTFVFISRAKEHRTKIKS